MEDKSEILKAIEAAVLKGMTLSLKVIPLWVEAIGAGAVIAAVTGRHPGFRDKLVALEGKVFKFEAVDIGKAFYLHIKDRDISVVVHIARSPDVTMRGTVSVLLDVFTGRVDPDTVFFSRRLEITGDTAAAVHLKNILAALG
jgi:predicted lipid carrier protein YhbT